MQRKDLTVRYYFWTVSDWAYFGGERFQAITERYGVEADYRPIKLLEVYARTGGLPLRQRASQRQEYRIAELKRWRARLGIPLNLKPKYSPTDDEPSSRVIIAAKRLQFPLAPLTHAIMRALWAEERNIADPATLREIGASLGLDMEAIMAEAETDAVRQEFMAYTDAAPGEGVFGSPFYIFQGEPFWGQDRLDFLDEAIARAVSAAPTSE
jgi:2-hydroxychromene-2-carboxylate isomerase